MRVSSCRRTTYGSSSAEVLRFWWQRFLTNVKLSLAALSPSLFVCCFAGKTRRDSLLSVRYYTSNLLRFPSSLLYLHSVWNDYSLAQSFGAGVLRPSNSSSRVSLIPHALIGATHLIAARHVVLALKAHCYAVEVLFACSIPLFLIEFVTAWSWYGHFSKSLFSLNLWLVVYRLAVLYRYLSVNISLQGNTTAFWDWSQVFGDRTFWVPGLYRTLSQ